jgi:hypothetical protein
MIYSLRIYGNKIQDGGVLSFQSVDFHPSCERITIGNTTMILTREHASSGPKSQRNVMCTYLINYHSKLYPNNDFRIMNGPYRLIAIDENNGTVLNQHQLEFLMQDIRNRMNADILLSKYETDITPAAGAAIKKTLY